MARRTIPLALLLFVLFIALVTLGSRVAQGATDLVTAGSSSDSSTTDATLVSAEATTTTTTTVADENQDGAKRVVVVGDSLVVMAEDQLTATFAANGVEVTYIAVSGTGILTDQGVRLTQLEEALEQLHPDAVIIESCCNYDGTYTLADGTVVPTDSQLLWDVWAAQAQLMVSVAQAHDADVYVVVTPRALENAWFSGLEDRIEHFNEIYRSLGVPVIDWGVALYPEGTTTGLATLRHTDGLHLTDEGDELVAAATWAAAAGSFDDA
jgi:hypothetical protein